MPPKRKTTRRTTTRKKKTTKKKGAKPTNPALYARVKAEAKRSLPYTPPLMQMLG